MVAKTVFMSESVSRETFNTLKGLKLVIMEKEEQLTTISTGKLLKVQDIAADFQTVFFFYE